MDPTQLLLYIGTFTATFKYLLLFLGVIIEGPILMVASGFLLRVGVFEPLPLYIVIILGDLAGDIFWYSVGKRFVQPIFERHEGYFLGISYEKFERIKMLFDKYHESILFISKITLGFGLALGTLIVAGATRVPFKKYLALNFLGEVVLVSSMLLIGYLFGELYVSIQKDLKIISLIGAVALVLISGYGFVRFVKTKIKVS